MKKSFSQFLLEQDLLEARIAVPETIKRQTMNVVASAYFSYFTLLAKEGNVKLGQGFVKALRAARKQYGDFAIHDMSGGREITGTVTYDTSELPERYTKGLRNRLYPIKIHAGPYGEGTKAVASYHPMGRGSSGAVQVNLQSLHIESILDRPEAIQRSLESLQDMILQHELQHVTQDTVLRKRHPKQMDMSSDKFDAYDVGDDEYYASDIEFQPQITTAAGDFKRQVSGIGRQLSKEQLSGLMLAFVDPTAKMPEGLLRYKPYFQSNFFSALFRTDKKKWKKAAKDFHGLLTTN